MSGMLVGQQVNGTPLFRQFLVRSDAAVSFGVDSQIPGWVAPPNIGELTRTFLQKAWMPAIGLMLFRAVFGSFDNLVMGYGLFRITNDVERLPFPMAPMGAMGIVAVSEQVEGSAGDAGSNMRWRMFCVGSRIGMAFGLVYIALAIAVYGIHSKSKSMRRKDVTRAGGFAPQPKQRGNIPDRFIIGSYLVTCTTFILVSRYLIDWHRGVMAVLVFFGFFYT